MSKNTKKITRLGLLAAISIVLVAFIHFPLFAAAPFLEYDPADVPILVATFMYGPLSGLLVTIIAAVIQGITVSASSGFIGILMHLVATGSFCLVSGFVYERKKTRARMALASVFGCLTMTVVMAGWNLVMTPIFSGMPVSAVAQMLVPIIIPFNLLKAGINALITFLLMPMLKLIAKD